MKLIVQIPCFNEAQTLPLLFEDMPRQIEGIDEIEFLVIDDGSTDETSLVAARLGIHHVLRVPGRNRRWLGRAFNEGIRFALQQGADIVVNTDGDNQYPSAKIADLLKPILEERADIVIGDRHPASFQEFSLPKRMLQRIGNGVIQVLTGEPIRDAVSGFRAYNRRALLQINVITNFTYTVDTLIQSLKKGLAVEWLDIEPNPKTRESRLIASSWSKVRKSGFNIFRLIVVYDAFRTFLAASFVFLLPALFLLGRFLYIFLFAHEDAAGHVQSIILGGALLVISVTLAVFSVIAGLLSVNRILLEDILLRLKTLEQDDKASRPVQLTGSQVIEKRRAGIR